VKKKYIGIIISIAVAVVVAILVVVNPFGLGDNSSNSTPNGSNNETPNKPPETSNWIGPGKVLIENYTIGTAVDYQLEVHNGNNQPAEFSVAYRHPDQVEEGYTRLPSDIQQYIWIDERRPVLEANETRLITIRLSLPIGFEFPEEGFTGKFEFWIGVIDRSQTGNIITELAQRWLVTMA